MSILDGESTISTGAGSDPQTNRVRQFETGATRDTDTGKFDYEGFLSPLVIRRYGAYMHAHRKQSDGNLRDSDNWTKGIPRRQYLKSMLRHMHDVWLIMRGWGQHGSTEDLEEACCAVIFNAMGLLHEKLMGRSTGEDPGPCSEKKQGV